MAWTRGAGSADTFWHRMAQAKELRRLAQSWGVDFRRPEWEAIGRLKDRYEQAPEQFR